jgi:hypothetical protein
MIKTIKAEDKEFAYTLLRATCIALVYHAIRSRNSSLPTTPNDMLEAARFEGAKLANALFEELGL